jgi:zinc protease
VCAVRCYLRGGARVERTAGTSALAARLLAEGTERRDWERLAVDLERRGMVLSTQGAGEAHGIVLDALAVDWEHALETVAELVFESTFEEERFEWQRQQTLAEIESLADQAEVVAGRAFLKQLYHPHPAGRSVLGDPDSLSRLDAAQCAMFHREGLERGAVLVVTGDIDESRVERKLGELFGRLAGEAQPRPTLPAPVGLDLRQELAVPSRDQAHLYVGHLTIDRAHPDLPALEVLGIVLGSGDGLFGRIPNRVREQEGLAYSVQVGVASGAGSDPGRLVVYAATADATAALAEAAIRDELGRIAEGGVDRDELEAARGYLLGREPFRRETARQWADLLAESLFYEIPYDDPEWIRQALERVDVSAVREAARRHIRPQELRVTLGRPKGLLGGRPSR